MGQNRLHNWCLLFFFRPKSCDTLILSVFLKCKSQQINLVIIDFGFFFSRDYCLLINYPQKQFITVNNF